MGACGCGDFAADFQLPGPDGMVYAIQKYQACHECGTPSGIVVYRLSPEHARDWGADELPAAEFQKLNGEDFDGQSLAIGVIDSAELWAELKKRAEGDDFELTVDEDTLEEALDEVVFKVRR